jgi:hypothetical protein
LIGIPTPFYYNLPTSLGYIQLLTHEFTKVDIAREHLLDGGCEFMGIIFGDVTACTGGKRPLDMRDFLVAREHETAEGWQSDAQLRNQVNTTHVRQRDIDERQIRSDRGQPYQRLLRIGRHTADAQSGETIEMFLQHSPHDGVIFNDVNVGVHADSC